MSLSPVEVSQFMKKGFHNLAAKDVPVSQLTGVGGKPALGDGSSIDEWIRKMRSIHTVEYYMTIKRMK